MYTAEMMHRLGKMRFYLQWYLECAIASDRIVMDTAPCPISLGDRFRMQEIFHTEYVKFKVIGE